MRVSARSVLALVLLLIAAGVPSAAWFIAGSREAEREAQRLVEDARAGATRDAAAAATRLATQLESIRARESQRPYFHYQNLFHDPRGASQGLSVVPSPLSQGPLDPLILAHFQIDAKGTVSIPTLNEELAELSAPDVERQRVIRESIVPAASDVVRMASPALVSLKREMATQASSVRSAAVLRQETITIAAELPVETPDEVAQVAQSQSQQTKVQKLDPGAFSQNVMSNQVYAEIKSKGSAAQTPKPKGPPSGKRDVEIATSDFAWTTLPIGGKTALVALRSVIAPTGTSTQGFVIAHDAVVESLRTSSTALRLASSSIGESGHGFPIAGTGWSVEAGQSVSLENATQSARQIRETFRRNFYAGLAVALIAIGAVATLIFRSEKLARERSQFAAAAAHELRTPLAGLKLYGDMLAHQLGDPARSHQYALQVAAEADRLGRVVTNMLEFTRLEHGSLAVKPESGDLAAAVRACVEQLRPALEASGCSVKLTIADGLPVVGFDRDALHQIVQNLIDNAEKYSRSSGDRAIEVTVDRHTDGVALSVSDRGTGIAPHVARHLFAPFERGGVEDAPAGLGLGLVLVRALAEAHGGDVSFAARSGGGTIFTVFLPALQQS